MTIVSWIFIKCHRFYKRFPHFPALHISPIRIFSLWPCFQGGKISGADSGFIDTIKFQIFHTSAIIRLHKILHTVQFQNTGADPGFPDTIKFQIFCTTTIIRRLKFHVPYDKILKFFSTINLKIIKKFYVPTAFIYSSKLTLDARSSLYFLPKQFEISDRLMTRNVGDTHD